MPHSIKWFSVLAALCIGCSSAAPSAAPAPVPGAKSSTMPEFLVPSSRNSPFSGVVRAGNLLFVAGQIGVDSARSGIAGETTSAMSKIGQLLQRAGSGLDHVAKCTVFLADMKDWAAMNEAYIKFFPSDKRPARSSFGTTGIAQGGRVEIECIATTE